MVSGLSLLQNSVFLKGKIKEKSSVACFILIFTTHWFDAVMKKYVAMDYFNKTYEQSRNAFLKKAVSVLERYPKAVREEITVTDQADGPLTTDILYIPSEEGPETLVVVTSGVHGIEAFTGSALQLLFLDEFLLGPEARKQKTAFLFVHSVNPFGHKYYRRVDGNNVDINRNFDTSETLFLHENAAYASFHSLLNPETPYRRKTAEKLRFLLKALKILRKKDVKTFRQAVLQGQYAFEKGIFFGGKRFAPQKEIMEQITCRYAERHRRIILIDLHTGYGYRGRLHLIGMDEYLDPEILKQLRQLYPGEKIEVANKDSGDFYKISGSMLDFIYKVCSAKNKTVLPVAWEFGTFDNIKTRKSLESLRIMISENQGFHYGYANEKSRKKALDEFRNLYYPDDPKWRAMVLDKGRKVFGKLLTQVTNV